ncbi:unnamed protein product [Meloidogyne enterolobii]|uniref:Uncharacterized protein n=1 Tax=Meloidogyne enterolobii TaxID=390850 RepID=A0ACB0Y9J1_MELEN
MIRQKFNKIVLLFLLLICYYREIEGNGGEDERGGGKIKGSEGEVEGGKVVVGIGGIRSEVEGGKLKVGGGKGGDLQHGGGELGGVKNEIKRGEEVQIEAKGGERVPEQFIKKSDKETKSLKKVWGKIENKKEEIGDEKEYENDFPSLSDSKNVTKKTMKYKYLSAKKGEKKFKNKLKTSIM